MSGTGGGSTPRVRSGKRPSRGTLRAVSHAIVGTLGVILLRAVRASPRKLTANLIAAYMRGLGPWRREHRIGRANLAAAFPEKSPQEIEAILTGVWDNLGRIAVEFAHIDRLTVSDTAGNADIQFEFSPEQIAKAVARGPVVFFTCHLANWEIPALFARHHGFEVSILYHAQSIRQLREEIEKVRSKCLGPLVASGPQAPLRLARALQRRSTVGMLIDQHEVNGVDVTFFGRSCKVSMLLARLASRFDAPIFGFRSIRLPDRHSFKIQITDAIEPVRIPDGKVDEAATMQKLTSIIESWVREHPEQWLWLHRRWR